NTDNAIGKSEEEIRKEVEEALKEVEDAMINVDSEVNRIETEVIPKVEKAVDESYVPKSDTEPEEVPTSGLWWDTSVIPPRFKQYDEETNTWKPVAPTEEEVAQEVDDIRDSMVADKIEEREYTDAEILAVKNAITTDMTEKIGDVNSNITSINNKIYTINGELLDKVDGEYVNNRVQLALDTLATGMSNYVPHSPKKWEIGTII